MPPAMRQPQKGSALAMPLCWPRAVVVVGQGGQQSGLAGIRRAQALRRLVRPCRPAPIGAASGGGQAGPVTTTNSPHRRRCPRGSDAVVPWSVLTTGPRITAANAVLPAFNRRPATAACTRRCSVSGASWCPWMPNPHRRTFLTSKVP